MDDNPIIATGTDGRDAKGRFSRGNKLGRNGGRNKGSVCRIVSMARAGIEQVLPDIIQEAIMGDERSRDMLLRHGMPKTKPVSVHGAIPDNPAGIIHAMQNGELDASTASEAMGVLLSAARIEEISKLQQEVEALKEAMKSGGLI